MRSILFGTAIFFLAVPTFANHNININTADFEMLKTLTGIGDVKAQAIIDYRIGPDGPFETIEEIMDVSGIGTATFENIKNHIVVSGGGEPESASEAEEDSGGEENIGSPPEETSSGGVFIPDTKSIFIDVGKNRTVFVGADSTFSAIVTGSTGDLVEGARVAWSFGNGDRKEGRSVLYNFAYPGTYVVAANASNDVYAASGRITVTAIPAHISIVEVTNDYISLLNSTDVEVDIGGWLLFASGKQFRFPQNTIIMAGQEVLISNRRTGLSGANPSTVALQYPNGLVATTHEYPLFISKNTHSNSLPVAPLPNLENSGTVGGAPENAALTAAPALSENNQKISRISVFVWLSGLLVLVGAAAFGVLAIRQNTVRGTGYAIEEITDDD